jgi:hypothetical protein
MNLGQEINVETIPETSAFAPIPAGWYQASIKVAELKTSTAGDSTYISIQYSILGPAHQGRVVFGMCGVSNNDTEKEKTSRYFLGQLMRACGIQKLTDTDQLVGANLEIKLKITPANDKYDAKNDVKEYRAIAGSALPVADKVEGKPAGGSTPPWAKK